MFMIVFGVVFRVMFRVVFRIVFWVVFVSAYLDMPHITYYQQQNSELVEMV